MMLSKAVTLTLVLAGTGAWTAYHEPPVQPTWTGEEFCERAAQMMSTALRRHACVDVLARPRAGAAVPDRVRDDAAVQEPRWCTDAAA